MKKKFKWMETIIKAIYKTFFVWSNYKKLMVNDNIFENLFKSKDNRPQKYCIIIIRNDTKLSNNLLFTTIDVNFYNSISTEKKNYNISNKVYLIPNVGLIYNYLMKKFTKEIAIKIFNHYFDVYSLHNIIQKHTSGGEKGMVFSSINRRLRYYISSAITYNSINKKYNISINTNTNSCSLQLSLQGYMFKKYTEDISNLIRNKFLENLELDDQTKKIIIQIQDYLNKNYTILKRANIS